MKLWAKLFLGVSLSLMCLFTSIGYAQFSSPLYVSGDLELEPPNAIFIVGISDVQASEGMLNSSPVNIGFPSTKVMNDIVFDSQNNTISFNVLIKNGTPVAQYYDKLKQYDSVEGITEQFSYDRMNVSVQPGQGTKIEPGAQQTFTVTMKYTGSSSADQHRFMLHEFLFVLHSDDLTQAVSKGVTDKFADILNNRLENEVSYTANGSTETVYPDQTYNAIINNMENDTSGNYIGNLMGATEEDKALLTALFEGELTFPVGNEEVPVTVMVKQKDVDNSGTDDFVLYITADDLGDRMTYVPVYAAVFSKNATGEWGRVGDIYAGEARVNGYNGSYFGTGSFDTESWRSTSTYYGVGTRSGISAIIKGYLAQKS